MGLIRVIIFALVVWLVWRMIKSYQIKQARRQTRKRIEKKQMVKCDYCQVHLPMQEAVQQYEHWFCNDEHKRQFLERSQD